MEWKEIFDRFRRNQYCDIPHSMDRNMDAYCDAIVQMLEKLTSEEALKFLAIETQMLGLYAEVPKEKPVNNGFSLVKYPPKYEFYDDMDRPCRIDNYEYEDHLLVFGRYDYPMHLTQEMVRVLLPLLQQFADKGEID